MLVLFLSVVTSHCTEIACGGYLFFLVSVGRVETVGKAACHWLGSLLVDLTAAATACDLALLSPLSLPVLW